MSMISRLVPLFLCLSALFVAFFCHAQDSSVVAQYKISDDSIKQRIAAPEASYAIGVYGGINNASTYNNKFSFNPRASFLFYGQFALGPKWEIEAGIGEIFYSGKSLNYSFSKLVFDTVDIKKYRITDVGYLTVPVLLKYKIGRSKIVAGARFSGVSQVTGTGSSAYYLPSHSADTVLVLSKLDPGLPDKANHFDVGGVIGYEFAFSKHFLASLLFNVGIIPIFPDELTNTSGSKMGNYNVSAEFGLHYLFYNYK